MILKQESEEITIDVAIPTLLTVRGKKGSSTKMLLFPDGEKYVVNTKLEGKAWVKRAVARGKIHKEAAGALTAAINRSFLPQRAFVLPHTEYPIWVTLVVQCENESVGVEQYISFGVLGTKRNLRRKLKLGAFDYLRPKGMKKMAFAADVEQAIHIANLPER